MPVHPSQTPATRPWQLQVTWTEVIIEERNTFEAAHDRAIELCRDHANASGVVWGKCERVTVNANYYTAAFEMPE